MAIKSKGYLKKTRNSKTRKEKSIIVLATEGNNKTEKLYFQDFAKKQNKRIVFISNNDTDPVKMVEALIKTCKGKDFDKTRGDAAYCLIDSDFRSEKNQQIQRAEERAENAEVEILVSGPCFEIWFLCHFHCRERQYHNNDEVIEWLRKEPGCSSYQKNCKGMFDLLNNKLEDAIRNAKRLEKNCKEVGRIPHTINFIPSTEVYKLAEKLLCEDE